MAMGAFCHAIMNAPMARQALNVRTLMVARSAIPTRTKPAVDSRFTQSIRSAPGAMPARNPELPARDGRSMIKHNSDVEVMLWNG